MPLCTVEQKIAATVADLDLQGLGAGQRGPQPGAVVPLWIV